MTGPTAWLSSNTLIVVTLNIFECFTKKTLKLVYHFRGLSKSNLANITTLHFNILDHEYHPSINEIKRIHPSFESFDKGLLDEIVERVASASCKDLINLRLRYLNFVN